MRTIRKNDQVVVIIGKDKGKQGSVIEVLPKEGKVKVKDVAILTCHKKARKQGDISGIVKNEGSINLSNVMLVCSACKKPSRVSFAATPDGGKKVRMCKRCKEII